MDMSSVVESSKSWWDNLGLLLAAILGAIAAGLLQFGIEFWKNKKLEKSTQIEAHSNLLGCKHTLLQYLHSYFLLNMAARSSQPYAKLTAIGLIDYNKVRSDLESGKEDDAFKYVNEKFASEYNESVDLKESLRSKEKSEELQLEIGEIEERFWRCIGQIKTSFGDNKIDDFIKEIKKAEEALGAFDKDISQIFNEIEQEIESRSKSMHLDKNNKNKCASDPNKNRDDFVNDVMGKLKDKKILTGQDAKAKIAVLESKIDDLLNYLENILNNPRYHRECKLFCSNKTCPLKPASQDEPKR